jgi:hypothetical protein
MADAVEECLARVSALGVRQSASDRFELYVRRLREAAAGVYPGPLPWKEPHKRAQFYEAIAQWPALVHAVARAPEADTGLLRSRLEKALGGTVLPSPIAIDDEARGALFELSTAAMLRGRGFDVTLGAEHGLRATLSDLPPLAVECARVGDDRSWREGVRRLATRLDRRADGHRELGLPVLGREQLQGASHGLRGFDDMEALDQAVRGTLGESERRARKEGLDVRGNAPVWVVILVTPVLLRERGGAFGRLSHVMPYRAGAGANLAAARVATRLLAMLPGPI